MIGPTGLTRCSCKRAYPPSIFHCGICHTEIPNALGNAHRENGVCLTGARLRRAMAEESQSQSWKQRGKRA